MAVDRTEKGFEGAIEASLLTNGGYEKGDPASYDADLALDPTVLLAFLKDSQPKEWERLEKAYGATVDAKVIQNIVKNFDQRGTLDVIRKGITDLGIKFKLAFFMPATKANPATLDLYAKNRLTVTRQVHHSPKNPSDSIDMVLFVNGIPIATAELKNPPTGQTVADAKRQYKFTRNPNDPLFRFKVRALVHFAVDTEEVYMATRLAGKATFFLPFNKGNQGSKGNPKNPDGYRTAYLWEEVWQKDRWMDILARFVHLSVEEKIEANGKKVKKETLIFPRYHQLDAVTKLLAAAKVEGPGNSYLIQHSAGSGKSNSIAWLAHRLANLHDDENNLIFSSVIVITDRRVLDKQLQDTIYQFDHVQGVVERIDKNSSQLGDALASGKRVIITTLQKFPFVLGAVGDLAGKNFAIIADEAHSSQTGEAASKLKQVLSAGSLDAAERIEGEVPDTDDLVLDAMRGRGKQPNLSFFAFTATPKKKTLEIFGRISPTDGLPQPFHLYSMRQAVEEGFIHDVLKHYTTYKTYYRLEKAIEDDPEVDTKKAKRAIARFVSLHPHNLEQKTQVMIEHFRAFTRKKIGGRAKAMVVTRSRLHAVRYKQAFDKYIAQKGYDDLKALVAFSGTVEDEGEEYTEPAMNKFGEKELPEKFATDDYQILLVAEKYQTGFDQPLLHTMYVDKKLKDLKAVQTLSRLNRTCGGKEDTFVLDFENEAEDIQAAFSPYFERTEIEEPTDPNQLYTLKYKLDEFQFIWEQDINTFSDVFFKVKDALTPTDQGKLHAAIDPAIERFDEEPNDERREDFRHILGTYIRLYSFLSQMVDFLDVDLEKLYVYCRFLRSKLPQRDTGDPLGLDEEVQLDYYRLDKVFDGDASIEQGYGTVGGPTEVGTGGSKDKEDKSPLSQIITVLNDKFGTDFTDEDRLLFDQVIGDLLKDTSLSQQARNNTMDNFKHAFDQKALDALIFRMERNDAVASQMMSNSNLRELAFAMMMKVFYDRARAL